MEEKINKQINKQTFSWFKLTRRVSVIQDK